jgi:tetratricopeptide (TPR) repeat protein
MRKMTLAMGISLLAGCAGLERQPDTMNHLELAEQAYQQGDYPNATANYTALLEDHPGYSYAHFKLGNIYLRQEDSRRAVFHYERAIENYAKDPRYWHNLTLARLKLTNETLAQAITEFQQEPAKVSALIRLQDQLAHLENQ